MEFKDANKNQLEAIDCTEGQLLIIAGPGTGKTMTLIDRTLNLIVNKKVDPSRIFLSTFTEKAAHELITRLSIKLTENGIDFNPNNMMIGTFHSICLNILKENIAFTNLKKNFNLKDQFDQQYFLYQNINKFLVIENFDKYIETKYFWGKCEAIMKCINRLTEEMVDYNDLISSDDEMYKFYGQVLKTYEDLRIESNFLDFSIIQVETYKMLIKYPDVAKKIIENIDYVMVDEYQDTNHIQEKLTLLFGSNKNNICVVGDDDQAIYRFRGATVRNILEFPKRFDNCKKVELVENYRSHRDIVKFYNDWMENTEGRDFSFEWGKYRYGKKIVSSKKHICDEKSVIKCFTKETGIINEKVLSYIRFLLDSGKVSDLNQIAFLFKSVKYPDYKKLADYLEKNGIPVFSPRSNMFFERKETMLIFGTLILMFPFYNGKISKKLKEEEILVKDGKKKEIDALVKYYNECLDVAKTELSKEDSKEFLEWMKHRIHDHAYISKSLDYAFSGLLYQMLEFKPFRDLIEVDLHKGIIDSRTSRNVGLFIELLVKFEYLNKLSVLTIKNIEKMVNRLFDNFFKFLMEGGISEYEDEAEYAPSGCISFMTIHESKGLEFPIVFVGSQYAYPVKQYDEELEQIINKFSGRSEFENKDMMKMYDFWRLYYVAFSRAQSLLIMLCDASKKNEPSKYFENSYNDLPYDTDVTKFTFDEVKKTILKNSYSFTSDINTYLMCPTQYKYFKELGFEAVRIGNTLFGTVVHETIEDIHKAVLRGEVDTITDDNIEKWFTINYKTASKLNNYYLSETNQEAALSQVNAYVEKAKDRWDIIKDVEVPINFPRDNYIMTGKVDLVVNDKGEYEILDFKTEKKPDISSEREKIDRVRMQLEVYAHLIEKNNNIKVSGMKAYYTSEKDSNPYVYFKRDEEHINDTIATFDKLVDDIEKKKFDGRCKDDKICRNCDLRFYCKRV